MSAPRWVLGVGVAAVLACTGLVQAAGGQQEDPRLRVEVSNRGATVRATPGSVCLADRTSGCGERERALPLGGRVPVAGRDRVRLRLASPARRVTVAVRARDDYLVVPMSPPEWSARARSLDASRRRFQVTLPRRIPRGDRLAIDIVYREAEGSRPEEAVTVQAGIRRQRACRRAR